VRSITWSAIDAGKKSTASSSATTASPGKTVAPPTRTGTFQSTPTWVAGRGSKPTASTGKPAISRSSVRSRVEP
jgi:hypothetical protein